MKPFIVQFQLKKLGKFVKEIHVIRENGLNG
jgi:hypothetical protein